MAIGLGLMIGCGLLLICGIFIFAIKSPWILIFFAGLLLGIFLYMDLPHILGHCEHHHHPKVEKSE